MLNSHSALLPTALLLALSAASLPTSSAAAAHAYRVALADDLGSLAVEARLAGAVNSLKARQLGSSRYLRDPRLCDDSPLQVRQQTLRLPPGENLCVRYEVDLAELARQRAYRRGSYGTLDRLTSPAAWLWQPPLSQGGEIQVTFDLPAGVDVSVPWTPLADRVDKAFRFGASPESSNAIVVFGGFAYRELAVPGATLRVSVLRGPQPVDTDRILAWLTAAAENVVNVFGRFPNPSPQVVVVPVPGYSGRSAVPFGRVIRDGGEAIQFFVDAQRPLQDFLDDWTATHEFSHLLLPYVDRKWISEGFASYYQNILMTRGGFYTQQRGWQKLHEGFGRGQRSVPGASPNEASGQRSGLMKIYWSGAAIALLADVALRSGSNPQTLDAVLNKLQACCLPSARMWGGRELFAQLDQLAGTTVFVPLYDRYADAAGFPQVGQLYADLGLVVEDGRITFDDQAPLAHIRQQIMTRRVTQPAMANHRETTP